MTKYHIHFWIVWITLAVVFFGAGFATGYWGLPKSAGCPECAGSEALISCPQCPAYVELEPKECPTLSCPVCPSMTCNCQTKSTADKSIHFRVPTTQCEGYEGKVRVRGNDYITYRWYDCAEEEWVEGDVDSDGWLRA